jgi:hypothetical protein
MGAGRGRRAMGGGPQVQFSFGGEHSAKRAFYASTRPATTKEDRRPTITPVPSPGVTCLG